MTATSHLSELKRKHQELEKQIEVRERSPGIDSLNIAKLKREKLKLKDEIARFSSAIH